MELKYSSLYSIKTLNDIVLGGYIDYQKEYIAISVNRLLNLSKNASKETIERYKTDILVAYFHETRHEKQLTEAYNYLKGKNKSAFAQVLFQEFADRRIPNDPINTFSEIDARFCSILKILDLEKRNVYKFKDSSLCNVMLSIAQMLDGINQVDANSLRGYEKDPFDPYTLVYKFTNIYQPFCCVGKVISCNTKEFRNKFLKEYEKNYTKFFKNEYKDLMQKMFDGRDLSVSTKINLFLSAKIRLFDKEDTQNLIDQMCDTPNRDVMQSLAQELFMLTKDENDIIVKHSDYEDYFKEKGIKYTKTVEIKFVGDDKAHKDFEKWLRKKYNKEYIELESE